MGKRLRLLLLCLVLPAGPASAVDLEDAERFVRLMNDTAYRPSAREIQRDYFLPASAALEAFRTESKLGGESLKSALDEQRFAYQHAVRLCLTAARRIAPKVPGWIAEIGLMLGNHGHNQTPVIMIFGDGRRGGGVVSGQVVLSLEVLCRFARDDEMAGRVLEAAIRHEIVHVHQLALQEPGAENSLLRQALIEGLADWVTETQMQAVAPQSQARERYGLAHEGRLWALFQPMMYGPFLGDWMYGPGADGQPADLGYWLGKRVVEAYIARSDSRHKALQELLLINSPRNVLGTSGYAALMSSASASHDDGQEVQATGEAGVD